MMTTENGCDTPLPNGGQDLNALYFTKAPGEEYLRVYAQYNNDPCWVPLPVTLPAFPDLQQVRDAGRNISIPSGSYEDAHFYLRSADGNNMTAAYFTNAAGGGIQVGNANDYAALNLQPDGGLLTYGGAEVATEDWVNNHTLPKRDTPVTNFNTVTLSGIYTIAGNLGTILNYPHIGSNNNGATAGYLVVYQNNGNAVQTFYPTNETATLNRGGGYWYRRSATDVWEYKNGVLDIRCGVSPVHADALEISGDYLISGLRSAITAQGYPDPGTDIPLMLTVRRRWGNVSNNYAVSQEAVSLQESGANFTRKWIRSRFNWRGNNPWDAWNQVGLLRDVYTKGQLNTSGAGGAVHWDNVSNKPVIVSTETDPTVPTYVKAITQANIDSWNAKENAANKSAAVALGTSDTLFPTQKAVKTYVDTAITTNNAGYIPVGQKGTANGVATLGSNGKIPDAQIPAIAITNTSTVASEAAMLALTAETGDVAVRTDISKSFILQATPASTLTNWVELRSPTVANSDQVPEGTTNLYFTNARSRNAISAVAPITYNSASGQVGISQASAAVNGYLTSGDWSTFNGKEPAIIKNTAFNKNFGTASGTIAEGNDSRINNGQTAYGWGNHAAVGYLNAVPDLQAVAAAGNSYTGDLILSTGTSGNEMFIGSGPGIQNTRVGQQALAAVTNNTARWNTAIGSNALKAMTSGYNNTAVGEWCMPDWVSDTTSVYSNNTAIGDSAMQGATSGVSNTAIGAAAGSVLGGPRGRGNYNIMIGQGAGNIDAAAVPGNGGNYNLFVGIGAGINVSGSNQLRIGTRNTTTGEHIIEGDMTNGTLALNSSLSVKTMAPYTSGGYNYVVWNNTTKRYETINPDFISTETDPIWTAAKPNTLTLAEMLGANVDLNTRTTTGIYYQNNNAAAQSGANYPVPYAGKLEVTSPYADFVYQDYHAYAGGGGSNRRFWRSYYNGSWNSWQEASQSLQATRNIGAEAWGTGQAYNQAAIQLRESDAAGAGASYGPRIAFHWGGVVASQIKMNSSGRIEVVSNSGTDLEDFAARNISARDSFRFETNGNYIAGGGAAQFLTAASAAWPIKAGGLTVSDSYTDNAPVNGMLVKGNTKLKGDKTVIGRNINTGEEIALVLGYSDAAEEYEKIKLIAHRLDNAARQDFHIALNNQFTFASATVADSRLKIDGVTGAVSLAQLQGTGTRMVVANDAGVLTTQSLPEDTSIYNTNGSLTGNRLVNVGANLLDFQATNNNRISINGGNNQSVGITSPYMILVGDGSNGTSVPNALNIRYGGQAYAGIKTTNITAARTHQLPNNNGTYVLSVNGVLADSAGNIALSSGSNWWDHNDYPSNWVIARNTDSGPALGVETGGGLATQGLTMTLPSWDVKADDHTLIFGKSVNLKLPDPAEFPRRMLRLRVRKGATISFLAFSVYDIDSHWSINAYSGCDDGCDIGTGRTIDIQSIKDEAGSWRWFITALIN